MSQDTRLQFYQEIVKDFYDNVRPRWDEAGSEIRKLGEDWVKRIQEKYKDDSLTVQAQDLLLQEIYRFLGNASPEPISYENLALVMKGGGVKGLAYVGALEILEKNGYEFNWFTGTSAGAIAAILLGSGHKVEELNEILSNKNFADFKDANILGIIKNFKRYKGLYEAHTFVDWIEDLLSKKLESPTAVRLQDLPNRTTVYASRKDRDAVIFDSKNESSRETTASFAARCSMSIPYYFTPQMMEGLRVFDGGTQNNFPVEALMRLQPNTNFIGLYLGSEHFKNERNSKLSDLLDTFTESSDPELLRRYKDKIVIIDPSPISTKQFKLSKDEKEFLLEAGRLGALKFLDRRLDFDKNEYEYNERQDKLNLLRQKLIDKKNKKKKLIGIIWILVIILLFLLMIFQPYIFIVILISLLFLGFWIWN